MAHVYTEKAGEPLSTGSRWLRLSPHLKTRRPSPRVLMIAITNPPYNLLDGNVLSELKRVLLALRPTATGAVILTSDVPEIFLSHYSVQEILDFSSLVPFPVPAGVVRGLLAWESWSAYFGFRGLTRRTPFAPLAHLNLYHEVTHLLRSIPQITIASLNGRAFGGGCELALACDFRVMIGSLAEGEEDNIAAISRGIGQPEIALGLIPGGGGTQMLTRLLGPAKALDLCLSGRLISAKEALQLGLLNQVVKDQKELNEVTIEMAKNMARRNPTAIQCIKDAIHVGGSLSLADGMRREQGNFGEA